MIMPKLVLSVDLSVLKMYSSRLKDALTRETRFCRFVQLPANASELKPHNDFLCNGNASFHAINAYRHGLFRVT